MLRRAVLLVLVTAALWTPLRWLQDNGHLNNGALYYLGYFVVPMLPAFLCSLVARRMRLRYPVLCALIAFAIAYGINQGLNRWVPETPLQTRLLSGLIFGVSLGSFRYDGGFHFELPIFLVLAAAGAGFAPDPPRKDTPPTHEGAP